MLGTIELMNIDNNARTAQFGRLLLNPVSTGKGHGTKDLKELLTVVFCDFGFEKVGLTVFNFSKSVLRCYEKVGFKTIDEEIRPNGWIAINMENYNVIV
ncbi:MAG: GNAT family N-acetyltransferase [Clostridiales bacterium]|nr:GNAT family N-acetyltransferase [Clostridiales bacterium]